jgi:hypothetical protein
MYFQYIIKPVWVVEREGTAFANLKSIHTLKASVYIFYFNKEYFEWKKCGKLCAVALNIGRGTVALILSSCWNKCRLMVCCWLAGLVWFGAKRDSSHASAPPLHQIP